MECGEIVQSRRMGVNRRALSTAALTALLVPVLIFAHELGHFAAGLAVGVPSPKLALAGFTYGPVALQPRQVALIAICGPVVTLSLAIRGVAVAKTPARLARAAGVAACMRLFELLPFGLAALARRARGAEPRATTFDEERAFAVLGAPGDVALIGATLVYCVLLVWILRRQTRCDATVLFAGGLLGWGIFKLLLEQQLAR